MIFYVLFVAILNIIFLTCPECSESLFYVSSLTFTVVLLFHIIRNIKLCKSWLNVFTIIVFKLFFLGYSFLAFFVTKEFLPSVAVHPFYNLNIVMVYVNIAYLSLYFAYNSNLLNRISNAIIHLLDTHIRAKININWGFVFIIYIISILIRLFMIKEGTFGVLLTYNTKVSSLPFYISGIGSYGTLMVFVFFLNYFKNKKLLFWCIFSFICELFFAIIGGFKSGIIIIFIYILISQYLATYRVKPIMLILTIVSVSFAYSIIEPYRQYVIITGKNLVSVEQITDAVILGYKEYGNIKNNEDNNLTETVLSRFTYIKEFTAIVEYKNSKIFHVDDPNFVERFWLAPILAITPRFIWSGRPLHNLGMEFVTWKVLNLPFVNSSSAFGPIGSLFLAGWLYVICGFLFVGFFIRLADSMLKTNKIGFVVISLGLLQALFGFEVEFMFFASGIMQQLVIVFFGQMFLFKK